MKNKVYSGHEKTTYLLLFVLFMIDLISSQRILVKLLGQVGLFIEHFVSTLIIPQIIIISTKPLFDNCKKIKFNLKLFSLIVGLFILIVSLILNTIPLIIEKDFSQIIQIFGNLIGATTFFFIQHKKWKI